MKALHEGLLILAIWFGHTVALSVATYHLLSLQDPVGNEHPPDHTHPFSVKDPCGTTSASWRMGSFMAYEKPLKEITNIALEKGIKFGSI